MSQRHIDDLEIMRRLSLALERYVTSRTQKNARELNRAKEAAISRLTDEGISLDPREQ